MTNLINHVVRNSDCGGVAVALEFGYVVLVAFAKIAANVIEFYTRFSFHFVSIISRFAIQV